MNIFYAFQLGKNTNSDLLNIINAVKKCRNVSL